MKITFDLGGRSKIVGWNATPDLAQATWEWPARWMGRWVEPVVFKASEDELSRWMNDAQSRWKRKFYGN
jgi:hypothetical protein